MSGGPLAKLSTLPEERRTYLLRALSHHLFQAQRHRALVDFVTRDLMIAKYRDLRSVIPFQEDLALAFDAAGRLGPPGVPERLRLAVLAALAAQQGGNQPPGLDRLLVVSGHGEEALANAQDVADPATRCGRLAGVARPLAERDRGAFRQAIELASQALRPPLTAGSRYGEAATELFWALAADPRDEELTRGVVAAFSACVRGIGDRPGELRTRDLPALARACELCSWFSLEAALACLARLGEASEAFRIRWSGEDPSLVRAIEVQEAETATKTIRSISEGLRPGPRLPAPARRDGSAALGAAFLRFAYFQPEKVVDCLEEAASRMDEERTADLARLLARRWPLPALRLVARIADDELRARAAALVTWEAGELRGDALTTALRQLRRLARRKGVSAGVWQALVLLERGTASESFACGLRATRRDMIRHASRFELFSPLTVHHPGLDDPLKVTRRRLLEQLEEKLAPSSASPEREMEACRSFLSRVAVQLPGMSAALAHGLRSSLELALRDLADLGAAVAIHDPARGEALLALLADLHAEVSLAAVGIPECLLEATLADLAMETKPGEESFSWCLANLAIPFSSVALLGAAFRTSDADERQRATAAALHQLSLVPLESRQAIARGCWRHFLLHHGDSAASRAFARGTASSFLARDQQGMCFYSLRLGLDEALDAPSPPRVHDLDPWYWGPADRLAAQRILASLDSTRPGPGALVANQRAFEEALEPWPAIDPKLRDRVVLNSDTYGPLDHLRDTCARLSVSAVAEGDLQSPDTRLLDLAAWVGRLGGRHGLDAVLIGVYGVLRASLRLDLAAELAPEIVRGLRSSLALEERKGVERVGVGRLTRWGHVIRQALEALLGGVFFVALLAVVLAAAWAVRKGLWLPLLSLLAVGVLGRAFYRTREALISRRLSRMLFDSTSR